MHLAEVNAVHNPLLQDIFALSSSYNTRPASEETINDPTNAEHYWWVVCALMDKATPVQSFVACLPALEACTNETPCLCMVGSTRTCS